MTKKVEKYNVFPNEFPENITNIPHKILVILHMEGMVERASLMIEGLAISSVRQAVVALNKRGMLNINGGFISLSEKGLNEYSRVINSEIQINISINDIIGLFEKDKTKPIGTKDICSEFLISKGELKNQRYRATLKLKQLKDNGIIVECRMKSNYREYYLVDSEAGQKVVKRNNIKSELESKESLRLSLSRIFQTALPGTLTADKHKPIFY